MRSERLHRLDLRTLGVRPAFEFTGGDRGWIGDNPFIYLLREGPRARLEAYPDDSRRRREDR